MCARNARQRWALVVALLVSLVAAASAHASGPRAARRALRADVPTSVTGDSLVVTDADPDASSSSIDAALVRRVAGDAGCVIVTWANDHYRDFARSWVGNLRALGLSNFMVGAMDADLHGFLRDEGVPTWLMGSRDIAKGTVERDFGWGTKTFHKMGRDKIRLIRDLTTIDGVDVLISDIDTAWLRDPVPFFRRYPDADMLVSTDQLKSETDVVPEQKAYLAKGINASATDDEGLELHICHAAMNIGVMWFRSTAGSRELTDEWVKLIEAKDELWDQNAFNDLVRLGGSCSVKPDGSGLMRGFRGKILVGTLPVSQFANGHVFHAQRMHSRKAADPFAVHNTFQYGGTPGKRHRMREANVWRGEDKNSRFLLKGADEGTKSIGFLSYAPRIPKDVDLAIFRERSWPIAQGRHVSDHRVRSRPGGRGAREAGGVPAGAAPRGGGGGGDARQSGHRAAHPVRPRPRVVPALRAVPGIAVFFAVRVSLRPRPRGGAVTKDGRVARALVFDPPGASRSY
jgi:hypothetical protein